MSKTDPNEVSKKSPRRKAVKKKAVKKAPAKRVKKPADQVAPAEAPVSAEPGTFTADFGAITASGPSPADASVGSAGTVTPAAPVAAAVDAVLSDPSTSVTL